MADERDDQLNDNEGTTPPSEKQGQQSELGQQDGRQTTSKGSDSSDGTSGQPIGGNDSNTGSGTTLSQGADFGGQSASGQAQPSGSGSDTMTTDRSSSGNSDTSGQSGSEGFIGSQGGGSGEYLREGTDRTGGSGSDATGGSDFANQGRGALDEDKEEDESGGGSTGGSDSAGGGSF